MHRTLALVVLSLLTAAAAAPGAHARGPVATIFEAPRELRSPDPAVRAAALDEIRGLGAQWLRVTLYWRDVAPAAQSPKRPPFDERDPGAYDWSVSDRAIREADARGLRVLLTVTGPVPKWATRARRDHVTRPSAVRFGRFTEAVGRRYRDVVDAYAIWNEPNHPRFLRPQWTGRRTPTSGDVYRALFIRGRRGLDAAGIRRVPVLIGETAPRGTGHVVHPLTFVRRALCLDHRHRPCGRLRADGYAHHPYTTRAGPFFRPPSPNDVTIGVLSRLNRVLARAGARHRVRKGLPIWITEFGVQTRPDPVAGVTEARQVEFLALAERLAHANRRVATFAQYLLRDSAPVAGATTATQRYSGFESGLRRSNGAPKRALRAYRLPLSVIRTGHRDALWGLVRDARGRDQVTVEVRRHGTWRRLRTVRTAEDGHWSARTMSRARRSYRVRSRAPDGTILVGPAVRPVSR